MNAMGIHGEISVYIIDYDYKIEFFIERRTMALFKGELYNSYFLFEIYQALACTLCGTISSLYILGTI